MQLRESALDLLGCQGWLLPQQLLDLDLSSLEMTLGRPEPSFLSAMGASEFFLAWSKILRRLLSGILSCALICFRAFSRLAKLEKSDSLIYYVMGNFRVVGR